MPANLPPTYYKLKHQHEAAKTDEERLSLLEEMLRIVPKHKGTEKVVSDLRKRIAVIKKGPSAKGSKGAGKKRYSEHIPKQGAGQIVMLGPPNSGKSLMLSNFTKAKSEVSPTPYTTTMPVVGMLQYENIQFQLIDTPSIMPDFISSTVLTLVRNADLRLGVVSLASDGLLDELDVVLTVFNDQKDDVEDDEGRYLVVANQLDAPGAPDRLEILTEFYGDELQIYPISAETGEGKETLLQTLYNTLNIVRIYPKAPGKSIERDAPIVLPNGSTVLDAALGLHKDFAEFKFARIWGPEWLDGQPVSRDDVIYDGDVVEFHL
ncbi:MAG: 50S ribosome-binding GTPase [Candidatus Poribacteria bacterium]|nr:50S ribosome-binding GTPase [Candidatus Poribacteria bacterium]